MILIFNLERVLLIETCIAYQTNHEARLITIILSLLHKCATKLDIILFVKNSADFQLYSYIILLVTFTFVSELYDFFMI